jgi:hypothetical protein
MYCDNIRNNCTCQVIEKKYAKQFSSPQGAFCQICRRNVTNLCCNLNLSPPESTTMIRSSFAAFSIFVAGFAHAQSIPNFKTLEDFSRCNRDSYNADFCLDGLKKFAERNPKQRWAAGKQARLSYTHWVALSFFEPALGKAPAKALCEDADLSMAVVSGLALPPDYPGFTSAKNIYAGACAGALKPAVDKALMAESAGYLYQNVCAVYQAAGNAPAHCTPKPEPVAVPVVDEKLPQLVLATSAIGLIKVYGGPEGERVTIAEISNKPGYVWIRLDGIRGAYNGKTLLHKEVISADRVEFWTEINGKRWTTVQGRRGANGSDLNAFLPGLTSGNEISLAFDSAKSAATKAEQIKR